MKDFKPFVHWMMLGTPECRDATDSCRQTGISPAEIFDTWIELAAPGVEYPSVDDLLNNRAECERIIAGILGYA